MEGEKYNLTKAQEEADKLRKKVESGDAPNYGEAEKLVEKDSNNSISDLSEILSGSEIEEVNSLITDQSLFWNLYGEKGSFTKDDVKNRVKKIQLAISESKQLAESILNLYLNSVDFQDSSRSYDFLRKVWFFVNLNPSLENTILDINSIRLNLKKILSGFISDSYISSESERLEKDLTYYPEYKLLSLPSTKKLVKEVAIEQLKTSAKKYKIATNANNLAKELLERDETWKAELLVALLEVDSFYEFEGLMKIAGVSTKDVMQDSKLKEKFYKVFKPHFDYHVGSPDDLTAKLDVVKDFYSLDAEARKEFGESTIKKLKEFILPFQRGYESKEDKEKREITFKEIFSNKDYEEIVRDFLQSLDIESLPKLENMSLLQADNITWLDYQTSSRDLFKEIKDKRDRNSYLYAGSSEISNLLKFVISKFPLSGKKAAQNAVLDIVTQNPLIRVNSKEFRDIWANSTTKYDELPEPHKKVIFENIISLIKNGGVSKSLEEYNYYNIPDSELLQNKEQIIESSISGTQKFFEYSKSEEEIIKFCKSTESIAAKAQLSKDELNKLLEVSTIDILNRNLTQVVAILFKENLYQDILSSEEVLSVARECIIKNLSNGDTSEAKIIETVLNFSDEDRIKIDEQVSHSIDTSNLIKFIRFLGEDTNYPLTALKVREMIFDKLATDQDLADYFVENLNKYYQQPWVAENVTKAIQQYSVARKFIYAVENTQTVWKNEAWVVDILAKAKVIVEEHKKQFPQEDEEQGDSYGYSHGNQSFSESDPFANHPWRFGGRQIRIASAISELMAGKANVQGLKELGINSKEISPLLAEANEKVNTAYQNFLEQIRSNTNIKGEDKEALLNPETSSVKMTSLLENIRSFVARYFVQSVEGDVTRLSEIGNLSGELDRILAEGFRRYIKIHEVDVPLYDKLYEEFDNLRETGRSPLEVYLGRDGIYAYIGRHSQDIARRKKLGHEGRKKLKEMGEVVEIHPQYTVYPRYFRDNLNQETKRQFLEQEGISPDADPLFYDTGYTGTIPEQIMRVMDFSDEDIEKRIRLLSAPSVHRRVKGIPENARSEIIEYIEHNAKTEETAEGLIVLVKL